MKAIDYHPTHLELIEMRDEEREAIDLREFLRSTGPATATLVHDFKVIAIIGVYDIWEGVAEVFVLPSIYVQTCPMQFFYQVRRVLKQICRDTTLLHRVQTRSLDDEPTNRWMRLLGFESEGVLKAFTPQKRDYRMWAITWAQEKT